MAEADFRADRVLIIGTGLLGASLGLALKARRCVGHVTGVNRSEQGAQAALQSGGIDTVVTDAVEAARTADVVVLCTPVGSMKRAMERIGPVLPARALVTDVGSTKRTVVEAVHAVWPGASRFVGAHPMAGSEKKGAQDAHAQLFDGATVVLTPTGQENADAVRRITGLWQTVGGRICLMSPAAHDDVVARTSHIPHVMASVLTSLIDGLDPTERTVVGKGFLDTTRVAAGDPEMWRDICLSNAGPILEAWEDVDQRLAELRRCLTEKDGVGLLRFFSEWRNLRNEIGESNERNTE